MKRKKITFYKEDLDYCYELPKEEQLPFLMAVLEYAFYGKEPDSKIKEAWEKNIKGAEAQRL